MDSSIPIVPFGKYKGKLITELMNDTEYLEWCKKQEFFKKYPIIYNICVNQTITNNKHDSKTPEHNKIQAMFLKKDIQINLLNFLFKIDYIKSMVQIANTKSDYLEYFDNYFDIEKINFNDVKIKYEFETILNWDFMMKIELKNLNKITLKKKYLKNNYEKNIKNIFSKIFNLSIDDYYFTWSCTLEDYSDIALDCDICFPDSKNINIYCEIKPLLGDDYPCVLRKMNAQIKLTMNNTHYDRQRKFILLIKDFSSSAITKNELIEIFKKSNISVIFLSEIESNNQLKIEELKKEIELLKQKLNQKEQELELLTTQ